MSTLRLQHHRHNRWLVEFQTGSGKVAIFISHMWWDREYKDGSNNPSDVHDQGAPDYQSGEKRDLKWRVVCAGARTRSARIGIQQ